MNERISVAIVDYGLGNLYSVQRACDHVGLQAAITTDPEVVRKADGIILPGVGAFGDAMSTLRGHGLVDVLREAIAADVPFMGICLGVQLLMTESHEFGRHEGLGIIEGDVVPFDGPRDGDRRLKVPEVCWNRVIAKKPWTDTPLEDMPDGQHMYFVHSYYVRPADPSVVLSTTRYGDVEYCSSVARGNLFACQFHPERSGSEGLVVYRTWAAQVAARTAHERKKIAT
jgi:glutamine amidotransferase